MTKFFFSIISCFLSCLSLWSAEGQSLVNQNTQWYVGISKIMRVVTANGHRGGHGIDTRGSRN